MPNTKGFEGSNSDEFEPIKPGWYPVEIDKVKERTSAKGNQWLKLWLKSEYFGGFAWIDISLNPVKPTKLKLLKDCLGISDEESNPEVLIGGKLWAYCFTGEDNFGTATKIADIKADPPVEGDEIVCGESDLLPF